MVLVGGTTSAGCSTVGNCLELVSIPLADDVTHTKGCPSALECAYITCVVYSPPTTTGMGGLVIGPGYETVGLEF